MYKLLKVTLVITTMLVLLLYATLLLLLRSSAKQNLITLVNDYYHNVSYGKQHRPQVDKLFPFLQTDCKTCLKYWFLNQQRGVPLYSKKGKGDTN